LRILLWSRYLIVPEFGSTEEGEGNSPERLGGLLSYYYRDAA
jgi:hypothetical protein